MEKASHYRRNVGMIVAHPRGQGVLWCRRINGSHWQFPQGGIDSGESPDSAAWRELYEETGLTEQSVCLVARTQSWVSYRLPKAYRRPDFAGQQQLWYLFRLTEDESSIRLDKDSAPEFDDWRWVSYWYPLDQVIDFKREAYRTALLELVQDYGRLGANDSLV